MRHKILGSFFGCEWISELFILENNSSKDISKFMDCEGFPQDHFIKRLRHSSKHYFVSSHESSV